MSKDNKFFDDLYKIAGSTMNMAFGTVADMKKQFDDMVNSKIDAILAKRGVVSQEEFEVARKMAQTVREKQIEIEARLTEIEKNLNAR